MTNKEAIGFLQSRVDLIDKCYPDVKDYKEALVVAIKALEQEPCEDAISRQAVLEKAINVPIAQIVTEDEVICRKVVFVDDIENLPPVIPQPKTGRWMHPYESDIACECSECHIQMPITKDFNYCPNCGTKMEVTADADSN
jgi:hypothetical protein